ncbi:MAG: exodeoxyribonuclease VII large subunit [Bacteroidetes bacterium]|nr:exodeoxyribonuclease VII large subunit [Bacteroidota bacterium]MBU1580898.1 exodeoxyribonuclease VII large subunit [Bacteroidota bacterium]MBU2558973.1 exodeoxyribonuclease VII large subunit [Bacteroidota bacterium]
MPTTVNNKQVFSLLEVTDSIRKTINQRYNSRYWVKAEMNKLNHYPRSGHCYPDLLQKEAGKIVAQIRGTLWKDTFAQINQAFLQVMQESLRDGIGILMLVSIKFDPNYGLTLQIHDIDPTFTLGDLEREKQETISKLKAEGIFDQNKNTSIPLLPKRLAIISVSTSKGYADFLKITEARMNGFALEHYLFPSLLQGEQAVSQMLKRLEEIRKVVSHFDLVAIIRGGGGEVGLSSFNHYTLAKTIATFPIPVITGIGHATNQTVCEMVAHTNAVTPSDLADIIMDRFEAFRDKLTENSRKIGYTLRFIAEQQRTIEQTAQKIPVLTKRILSANNNFLKLSSEQLRKTTMHLCDLEKNKLKSYQSDIQMISRTLFKQQWAALNHANSQLKQNAVVLINQKASQLELADKTIQLLDPQQILKRGFSLSFQDGKLLQSAAQANAGSTLQTVLKDGTLISTITSIKKANEQTTKT